MGHHFLPGPSPVATPTPATTHKMVTRFLLGCSALLVASSVHSAAINATSNSTTPSWSTGTVCEQEWTHSWVNLCKVYKLFQQVTGVVKKTGEVVDDFNEDYKYLPENAGQDIADFADYSNVVVDYAVNYIAPMVRDHLPTMQEKINEMLDTVPDVADYLNEQIDEIPDEYRGKMAEMMVSVLEYIPENALPQLQRGLDNGYIKDAVDDHLRVLPSKNSMKRFLTHITELIEGDGWVPPAKERVQERVDEVLKFVDNIHDVNEKGQ